MVALPNRTIGVTANTPIYRIDDKKIVPIERTTFSRQGLRERHDIQSLLKSRIEVLAPDPLIVAEEFGEWEDSRRRIDLLGIDRNANLVVIALKRAEDGGHMELQASGKQPAIIRPGTIALLGPASRIFTELLGSLLGHKYHSTPWFSTTASSLNDPGDTTHFCASAGKPYDATIQNAPQPRCTACLFIHLPNY